MGEKMGVTVFVGTELVSDRVVLEKKIWLKPKEVAAILRIDRRDVYRMVDRGELSAKRHKGVLRVKAESVRLWMENCPDA